jgi:hypothetical protein
MTALAVNSFGRRFDLENIDGYAALKGGSNRVVVTSF